MTGRAKLYYHDLKLLSTGVALHSCLMHVKKLNLTTDSKNDMIFHMHAVLWNQVSLPVPL